MGITLKKDPRFYDLLLFPEGDVYIYIYFFGGLKSFERGIWDLM